MTPDAAGATPPQLASPPPHEPIRALLRAGKNDEAIVRLAAIVVTQPDDLDAKELLFDAFFQKRDWPPALALAEELVRRRPDVARLQKSADRDALQHEALRRGDPARLAICPAPWRGAHHSRRAQSGKFLYRQDRRGDPLRPARHRNPRRRSRQRAAHHVHDGAARRAARRQCHLVFAVGHGAVLQLRRDDQSRAVPDHLSGLDLPLLRRCNGAAAVRRLSARQRRAMCVSWKTNIPASACSSASW